MCQAEDADIDANINHRIICQGGDVQDFEERHSPRPIFRLGILLPEHEVSPRLVWVRFDGCIYAECEEPVTSEHIPEAHASGEGRVKRVPFTTEHEGCSDGIEIVAAMTTFRDGTKENKCLTKLMGGSEQYSWRGPVLVLHSPGHGEYADIEGSELQDVEKYFADRMSQKRKQNEAGELTCNFTSPTLDTAPGIKAVMASCEGDMREFEHAKFTQVSISSLDWSQISEVKDTTYLDRIGLGLIIWEYDSGICVLGTEVKVDEEEENGMLYWNHAVKDLLVRDSPSPPTW